MVEDKFPIDKSGVIRKFDLPSLNSQIDKAINSLEAGKTGMVVVIVNNHSASLAVVGKKEIGPGALAWTVVAVNPWDPKEGPAIEGQVRYSW